MDEIDSLHTFWVPLIAYTTLLGVYLVFLGIGLAGLLLAIHRRKVKATPDRA